MKKNIEYQSSPLLIILKMPKVLSDLSFVLITPLKIVLKKMSLIGMKNIQKMRLRVKATWIFLVKQLNRPDELAIRFYIFVISRTS